MANKGLRAGMNSRAKQGKVSSRTPKVPGMKAPRPVKATGTKAGNKMSRKNQKDTMAQAKKLGIKNLM